MGLANKTAFLPFYYDATHQSQVTKKNPSLITDIKITSFSKCIFKRREFSSCFPSKFSTYVRMKTIVESNKKKGKLALSEGRIARGSELQDFVVVWLQRVVESA